MTNAEKREAARQFYNKWVNKGREDEDDRSYWLDILQRVMGADDATDRVEFQKKVIVDGNTKRIDAYIPETRVIIEQKTLGIKLDSKIHQSGGIELTPYEQAKRYNDNLPVSEKARWIITSNFAEIWVYDMDTRVPENNITKISIRDLQDHYTKLDFLLSQKVRKISEEMELSLQAGELVGKIHDRFLEQYNDPMAKETQNSLNILCVRLVFCLYAEDAGLFGDKDAFSKYITQYAPGDIRRALLDLFKVLDTPIDQRAELYLSDELEAFPYVNGGLFARENIEIPKITQEIKDTIIESAHFDWSKISPTIFGAVFESTLNPETRRSGGMHYTSIENIHKVIDPLFLDDIKSEFEDIKGIQVKKTKENKLKDFQNRLASLKFLDPACGSGNFLTETYMCLRRIENEILRELYGGQMTLGFDGISPIKVNISQFYGIEINDFAVTVAKTALWIAESQMMKETEDILLMNLDFLPLKTNAYIIEGNALQLDWNKVVDKSELSYIMGNPPFVGMKEQTKQQKDDLKSVVNMKTMKQLDYVAGWYYKAANYIKGTNIITAFVSSNSITQGEQALTIWEPLFNMGLKICFACRTFIWDSEASIKAHVHCVIVGFSFCRFDSCTLYEDGVITKCDNINHYLTPGENIFISKESKPICNVPEMTKGAQLIDDGHFTVGTLEDYIDILKREPAIKPYIRKYLNGRALLNGEEPKYVLYLEECPPNVLKNSPFIKDRVEKVYEYRANNESPSTNVLKDRPSHYFQSQAPTGKSIIFSAISSGNRRYLPMAFMNELMVLPNTLFFIDGANMYHFGVLMSNVHMAWMRTICGRLKSDYRYSNTMVYNTFPWPTPTEEQKAKIEETAKGILDARALYPDCSLADLYDPLTMPKELKKAHQLNDKAVMQAYGFDIKNMSEADCVAKLMKMYQELSKST